MKICILKESLAIGGTERSAANVSKVLCEDYEVYMTLYDAADIKYSFKGQLVDFSLPPKPTFAGKVVNTILRDIKLRKFLRKEKVNLVYMFTTIGNRQTRYKYKTPKIISARDFGKMQERYKEYNLSEIIQKILFINTHTHTQCKLVRNSQE